MKRESGIAQCGLACCLCSENITCNGCNSGECPRMSSLLVDYPYIFCAASLCVGSYAKPPLKGVYHRNGSQGSHADDLFPRERDMAFSYISSVETRLWLK